MQDHVPRQLEDARGDSSFRGEQLVRPILIHEVNSSTMFRR
jgi:hypothetical protein